MCCASVRAAKLGPPISCDGSIILFCESGMSTKLIAADPEKGVKVNAGVVAAPFREEIKAKVAELKSQGIGR